MQQGWIKLHRKIQDHMFYSEPRKFSRYEAWIDILMMVNHSENKTLIDGNVIEVKRGQRITSIKKLEERWKWSNRKVMNFLELCQKEGMLRYEKRIRKNTLIEVLNYESYQGFEGDEENNTHNKKHHRSITEASQKHINKNDKNENNEKKKNIPSQIENLRSRYSNNQQELIDRYLEMIRLTRSTGKISDNVILKLYQSLDKYPVESVEYGLRTHVDNPEHHSKRENYTLGIIRRTSKEEATKKLAPKSTQKKTGQPVIRDFRDREIAFNRHMANGGSPEDFHWND